MIDFNFLPFLMYLDKIVKKKKKVYRLKQKRNIKHHSIRPIFNIGESLTNNNNYGKAVNNMVHCFFM